MQVLVFLVGVFSGTVAQGKLQFTYKRWISRRRGKVRVCVCVHVLPSYPCHGRARGCVGAVVRAGYKAA